VLRVSRAESDGPKPAEERRLISERAPAALAQRKAQRKRPLLTIRPPVPARRLFWFDL